MTKKLRSIIITLSVGIIALVAYFVVDMIVQSQGPSTTSTPQLTNIMAVDIASIKVTLQNGDYYYVTENAESSTDSALEYKVTFNGIYEGLTYNATNAKLLVSYVCTLIAQRDLGVVNEDEYSAYGMDDPTSVVTVTMLDGTEFNIYVGSSTNANLYYYCRITGSDHMYTINSSAGEMFSKTPNEMRITQFNVPFTLETIDTITWQWGDNAPIYIYRDLEASVYNPFTTYYISSPWEYAMPINPDMFSNLVSSINVMPIRSYVTPKIDGSEVNLADYGLDKPWGYYKVTMLDGTVQEFSFGDYDEEDGGEIYCYILDHSTNDIYTVRRSAITFISNYGALDVTTPYIINAYLDDIQTLTAEFDGQVVVFEHLKTYISDSDKTDDDEKDFTSKYRLDGMEYDEYAMSSLYMCATGMRIQALNKDYKHDEEAMLKLTFDPFDYDAENRTLEFYRIDNNYCAVYVNGVCNFLVSMTSVETFINGVGIVKAGGVPAYTL